MAFPFRLAVLLAAVGLVGARAVARDYRVTVAPADADRLAQVVRFDLPADAPTNPVLRSATGATLPVQVDGRKATFVLAAQRAGESSTFTLAAGNSAPAAGVDLKTEKTHLVVAVGGAAVFAYQMDKDALPRPNIDPKFKRAGYLHPVYAPSGKVISDDYPQQHIHHHGIWAPWTNTEFQGRKPDFWNMGAKTGLVEFDAVDRTWTGPVHGGFVSRHRFVDLKGPEGPVTALNETWEVTAYAIPGEVGEQARVFDLVITQTCATNDPLILPQFRYGGLGFRGRPEWLGEKNANFLTSEGETDRVKAHTSRSRWINIHGAVDAGVAGLTILGHPDNFRAPQPLRVHEKEPFINFAPSQAGEWRIEPGKPYIARYRFVTADGVPDRARLDAFWHGFASMSGVTLVPLP